MPNQGNQKQAPALVNNKQNLKQDTNQFYGIPQEIGDKIFIKLGNSSAQIKIMIVLIGTKTGLLFYRRQRKRQDIRSIKESHRFI